MTKRVGDALIGATMNTHGSLVMEAQKVGAETMLSQIVQMVARAQRSKAPCSVWLMRWQGISWSG